MYDLILFLKPTSKLYKIIVNLLHPSVRLFCHCLIAKSFEVCVILTKVQHRAAVEEHDVRGEIVLLHNLVTVLDTLEVGYGRGTVVRQLTV